MTSTMENTEINAVEYNSSDLSLYLQLGHSAASVGDEDEAKNWYSIGLTRAQVAEDSVHIQLFTRFIQTFF
jgi:hypothetical protein